MQSMHMLSSIALLVYASSAVAQETDIRRAYPKEDIDEIVVVGVSRCGSWPIEHYGLIGCEYMELTKEDLPMVLLARQKSFFGLPEMSGSPVHDESVAGRPDNGKTTLQKALQDTD